MDIYILLWIIIFNNSASPGLDYQFYLFTVTDSVAYGIHIGYQLSNPTNLIPSLLISK